MSALALLLALCAPASAAEKTMASVVSSKEWIVRRAPHREEEFTGDVRYKAGGNEFTSDWALFKHESQQWRARGRVVMRHALASGDTVTGRGDEAEFNQKSQKGAVLPAKGKRVSFERAPAAGGEPDEGQAGRLEWSGADNATLTDGAHIWGPRLEGWADRADFAGDSGRVLLSGGRPVLVKREGLGADWVGALKADTVAAERTAHKVAAQGAVRGWLEFRDLPDVSRAGRGRR